MSTRRRRIVATIPAPPYPRNVPVGNAALGKITLAVTFPPVAAGQDNPVTYDVWRREHGKPATAIRIAKNLPVGTTSYIDRTPASRVVYDYRIVARAATGTTTAGAWHSGDLTAPNEPAYSDIYGDAYGGTPPVLTIDFEAADFEPADFT